MPETLDPLELQRAMEGATRALRVCLSLSPGDSVAIFYDDITAACGQVLRDAAVASQLTVYDGLVRAVDHDQFLATGRLPDEQRGAIDASRAVLLCLESTKHRMAYRKALLDASVDLQRYVGVLPGATLPVLAHAVDIDYEQVRKNCEDLAIAMLVGDAVVLTSYWSDGSGAAEPHALSMSLGRFARSPITSTGVIPRGTWGNLPGGETFIAPLEDTANGTFALNGAFKHCVLDPDRPLVLSFQQGMLTDIAGATAERGQLSELLDWRGPDSGPLALAELGIGLNEGIGALTGNALFDEKKAGTAHIALGDNSFYGGTLHGPLHEDLVTVKPSLTIDGKAVLERGAFVLNPRDWRETEAGAESLGQSLPDEFMIRRTPTHAGADTSRRLRVRRDVGARRQCSYTVGTDSLSVDLSRIYGLLPPIPEAIWFSLVVHHWSETHPPRSRALLKGLMAVLEKHQLVAFTLSDDSSVD